jgi:single stranded DNA-binding protein
MVNKTILYGFLVADPEARYTKTGKCICNLRIAHRENYKDETKEPLYMSVDVWDKQGETCAKNLKKGSSVIVEGRLAADTYENKEGKKTTKTFIIADRVNFVPRFEKSEKNESYSTAKGNATAPKKEAVTAHEEDSPNVGGEGDDIPF